MNNNGLSELSRDVERLSLNNEAIDAALLASPRNMTSVRDRIMDLRDAARTSLYLGQESAGQAYSRRANVLLNHFRRYDRSYQG